MSFLTNQLGNKVRIFCLLVIASWGWPGLVNAAQLTLTWADNSTNENGFNIERKTGTTGTYAQIAAVAPNITSYTDSSLLAATTYCYRVYAFNAAGNSPYTPEVCGTTAAAVQTFTLTLAKAGTGSGTVTSSPAGINCGATCSASFNNNTAVTLTATAAAGSVFAGFTGGIGCSTGALTITANASCTATFNPQPVATFTLTLAKAGTGGGTVISSPAGINCGATCSASFNNNTAVTLTATAAAGSVFAGFTGTGCSTGSLTITANTSCTATFNPQPVPTFTLTLTRAGTGSGTVTSSPAGINCGTTCSASFNNNTAVTLTAAPASGSVFAGFTGGTGCSTGSLTITANASCTATFNPQPVSTFSLTLAKAGTGGGTVTSSPAGINCGATCSTAFNSNTAVTLTATPAAGSVFAGFSGPGCATGSLTITANTSCTATFNPQPVQPLTTRIGVFRPTTGEWFLDYNGNGRWDAGVDSYLTGFGQSGELPVVGNWNTSGANGIGTFNPANGAWKLDSNANGRWDGCGSDACVNSFGQPGDLPVPRKLTSGGQSIIGTFNAAGGSWVFDLNGNRQLDNCSIDQCVGGFGMAGDMAVVGNWNGTGREEMGIFRAGNWYLDRNGNAQFNGCATDKCVGVFGAGGDIPVVGDWDNTGTVKIGVYRPSTGQWFLDMNGNGKLDACGVDSCLGPFGEPGDLPVVGKW